MQEGSRTRRWYQFSLRAWLLLVIALSLALVGANEYRRWRKEQRARLQFEQTIQFNDFPEVR